MHAAIRGRVASGLLASHVVLIAFSTLALTTFLAGTPPAWLLQPASQRALQVGWTWSGPSYVVLGALAAIAFLAARVGAARAFATFAATSLISLGAELLGTSTGIPFGPYAYTTLLGYRIGGRVPFPIPVSWSYMVLASVVIVSRLMQRADDSSITRWRWALASAAVLTAWDVSMDPAMVVTSHWTWHAPGFFYGMPLVNWLGWLLTGTIIARVLLAIVPPTIVSRELATSRLPLLLYAANGVFPIAICLRHELWWAAALGAAAMGAPLVLALRTK
ncbi:MAG: putative rane protein [Gemmatimonadetes bacterium]|nr:putative rane protein [Gemmatimonadota bacterium]